MRVYKVVRRRSSTTLLSAIVMGKAGKRYTPGIAHHAPRWLARLGYHITAFSKLEYAEDFQKRVASKIKIWECEAIGITRYNHLPNRCYLTDLCDGVLKDPTIPKMLRWPKGTVMCKTIKLIKEVT